MKTITSLAAAASLTVLLSACSSTGGEQVAASKEVVDPDKVTCRNVVKTGTRIGSKVCKTNRAWAESTRRAQDYHGNVTRTAGQGGVNVGEGAN